MTNKTDSLKSMLDNIINDKQEDAEINFHEYLQSKMKEVLGTVPPKQNSADEPAPNSE